MPKNNYASWKLPELKAELKARRAKTSGRKKELVQRLENLDEILHVTVPDGAINLPEPNLIPQWPEQASFKTLTPEDQDLLPPFQPEHLEQYVLYRQVRKTSHRIYIYHYLLRKRIPFTH